MSHIAGLFFALVVFGQPTPDGGRASLPPEEEVILQLKQQPIGTHTVEALDLPDEFLRRVGDRIIRMSYQNRLRMVVQENKENTTDPNGGANDRQAPPADSSTENTTPTKPRWPYGVGLIGLAALITLIFIARRRKEKT